MLCGARWADIGNVLDAGEAYLFRHDGGGWIEELRLTDAAPGLDASGSTSISANELVLLASGLPPGKPGIFLIGTEQGSLPFGNGVLCVGGQVIRSKGVKADATGKVAFQFDHSGLPPAGAIAPGDTRYFQLWYRDPPAGGAGFDLTDGLAVQFCP